MISLPLAGAGAILLAPDSWSSDETALFAAAVSVASAVTFGFVIYVSALITAPYRQRNEARAAAAAVGASPTSPILATPQLFIESSEYEFGEPGKRGYPQSETGAARSLRVDMYLNTTNGMQVESIELEVQGKRIPSTWNSNAVYGTPSGGYIYFEVTPELTSGLHQVRLVALADGKSWMSQPFSVTFP